MMGFRPLLGRRIEKEDRRETNPENSDEPIYETLSHQQPLSLPRNAFVRAEHS